MAQQLVIYRLPNVLKPLLYNDGIQTGVLNSHQPLGSVDSYPHLRSFIASLFMYFSAGHMALETNIYPLLPSPLCVLSAVGGLLSTSQLQRPQEKDWWLLYLLLCPRHWGDGGGGIGVGLRIAKLHYISILPSSVFSFVPWAPKNFLGSKSPCAKSLLLLGDILSEHQTWFLVQYGFRRNRYCFPCVPSCASLML